MIGSSAAMPAPTLEPDGWFGHAAALRSDPLSIFEAAARLGPPVVRLPVGPLSIWVALTPESAHEVLVAAPDRFVKHTRGQDLLRRTLGESVLTSEGSAWRWRRRLQQPRFKRDAVMSYVPGMIAQAATWTERIEACDGPLDVAREANDLTLQIACDALLGVRLSEEDKERVHTALDGILDGFFSLVTFPVPGADRLPLPRSVRHRRAVRSLRGVVEGILDQRRDRGLDADDPDVLGQLLLANDPDGDPLTREHLASEVVTLLLAGHETTANALAWTLALLSRHPLIRRRVEAELAEVVGDGPIEARHAFELPLLGAVLKESMRLYPPVWSNSRSTVGEETVGGVSLPPRSFIFVSTWILHRRPELWDDPEGFDPDRWLDGRVGRDQKRAYMPFGAGQRRCLGEHFATLEAMLILATLLRRVRLDLEAGQRLEPDPSVTLRPAGPLRMVPRPRT